MKAPWSRREPEQVREPNPIPELREKVAERVRREHRLRLELQRIARELAKQ